MSLPTLPKVQKLQAALHAKAKGSPGYRFYALYDKVYRADVLADAYERCRQNGGAAGVDGQTFEDIEAYGRGEVAGRTGGRTQREEVSSASRAAGVHSQAGRQATTVGDSDDQRSRRADGGGAGLGADLRGRSATGAIRVSRRPQRPGRGAAGAQSAEHGTCGGGGRGPERVLRQHPARRADEIGGPSRERQAHAASDQDVAGSTGGRDRRAGAARIERPATRTRDGAPRKGLRSHRC